MDIADIKKRYDYDKLDGDFFYEAVNCIDAAERVKDFGWLITEVERLKKDQYLEATTAWQLRAEKAEAEVEQLQAVFDMQQTRMGKATKLWQEVE